MEVQPTRWWLRTFFDRSTSRVPGHEVNAPVSTFSNAFCDPTRQRWTTSNTFQLTGNRTTIVKFDPLQGLRRRCALWERRAWLPQKDSGLGFIPCNLSTTSFLILLHQWPVTFFTRRTSVNMFTILDDFKLAFVAQSEMEKTQSQQPAMMSISQSPRLYFQRFSKTTWKACLWQLNKHLSCGWRCPATWTTVVYDSLHTGDHPCFGICKVPPQFIALRPCSWG